MKALLEVLKNREDVSLKGASPVLDLIEVTSTIDHPSSKYHAPVFVDDRGESWGQIDRVKHSIIKVIDADLSVGKLYMLDGDLILCTEIDSSGTAWGINPKYPRESDIEIVCIGDSDDLMDCTILEWS